MKTEQNNSSNGDQRRTPAFGRFGCFIRTCLSFLNISPVNVGLSVIRLLVILVLVLVIIIL